MTEREQPLLRLVTARWSWRRRLSTCWTVLRGRPILVRAVPAGG